MPAPRYYAVARSGRTRDPRTRRSSTGASGSRLPLPPRPHSPPPPAGTAGTAGHGGLWDQKRQRSAARLGAGTDGRTSVVSAARRSEAQHGPPSRAESTASAQQSNEPAAPGSQVARRRRAGVRPPPSALGARAHAVRGPRRSSPPATWHCRETAPCPSIPSAVGPGRRVIFGQETRPRATGHGWATARAAARPLGRSARSGCPLPSRSATHRPHGPHAPNTPAAAPSIQRRSAHRTPHTAHRAAAATRPLGACRYPLAARAPGSPLRVGVLSASLQRAALLQSAVSGSVT